MQKKLIIGLTGGIGSGKSSVGDLFAELGIDVIDADQIGRELSEKNPFVLAQIQDHFGHTVLNDEGKLNRAVLRKKIFDNPLDRQWLEQLLHPLISTGIKERINNSRSPYCLVVIPLLFEAKTDLRMDRVLVIDTTEDLQLERTVARDQLSRAAVLKIMATQAAREKRLKGADDIITNDGDFTQLGKQVATLHKKYLAFTKS